LYIHIHQLTSYIAVGRSNELGELISQEDSDLGRFTERGQTFGCRGVLGGPLFTYPSLVDRIKCPVAESVDTDLTAEHDELYS
jgi:hypothetical protein